MNESVSDRYIRYSDRYPDRRYAGAIYKMTKDFHIAERDWNNDGDVYPQRVAIFEYVSGGDYDVPSYSPNKRIVYTYNDYNEDLMDGVIEVVSVSSLEEGVKDIINKLETTFEMSDSPIMGPSYIFPDGKFILIP